MDKTTTKLHRKIFPHKTNQKMQRKLARKCCVHTYEVTYAEFRNL